MNTVRNRPEPRPPSKRLPNKYLIGGAIAVVAIGLLIWSAASQATAAYLTIPELYERPLFERQGTAQRPVRVTGFVVGDSIRWDARSLELEFEIVENLEASSQRLPAFYHGPRPDMFRDGAQVVLEGNLSPEGVFVARTMLLQCPSKYQEAQP